MQLQQLREFIIKKGLPLFPSVSPCPNSLLRSHDLRRVLIEWSLSLSNGAAAAPNFKRVPNSLSPLLLSPLPPSGVVVLLLCTPPLPSPFVSVLLFLWNLKKILITGLKSKDLLLFWCQLICRAKKLTRRSTVNYNVKRAKSRRVSQRNTWRALFFLV